MAKRKKKCKLPATFPGLVSWKKHFVKKYAVVGKLAEYDDFDWSLLEQAEKDEAEKEAAKAKQAAEAAASGVAAS